MTAMGLRAWNAVMTSHSRTSLQWGPTDVDRLLGDPKRIAFFMSRYKFAAKMLSRCSSIIDVGCGSGMGTLTFLQDTNAASIVGLDFEREVIDHANGHLLPAASAVRHDAGRLEFVCDDFLKSGYANFDGLCCLDVIEHIDPTEAHAFIDKASSTLNDNGVAVIGTPSIRAAEYASEHSQIGHINLYDADRLRADLERKFRRVFMFSMNDEIVHTGFDKLAHYLMAVCVK